MIELSKDSLYLFQAINVKLGGEEEGEYVDYTKSHGWAEDKSQETKGGRENHKVKQDYEQSWRYPTGNEPTNRWRTAEESMGEKLAPLRLASEDDLATGFRFHPS
jgi:hypothetical protein